MKNIAIIPARSGSKRLKDKNLQKILNLELFLWTIRAAKSSKIIDKIIQGKKPKPGSYRGRVNSEPENNRKTLMDVKNA